MEFIKIENRASWLIENIPNYHPDNPKHTKLWRGYKKSCIEGVWGKDFGKYRFMPGLLYFYVNFCTILDVDRDNKARKKIRPMLRDLEWERGYMCTAAYGFSGFADDEENTCHWNAYEFEQGDMEEERLHHSCFNSEGKVKKFVDPRQYLRQLHDRPLGRPLYYNNAKNTFELGSRGGGKSYWYSLAVNLHELTFDGAKVYNEETRKNPAKVEVFIGAAIASKSSEMCAKIKVAMDELALNSNLGAWGKPGDPDYAPSPFYKDMVGSLKPNNADNPWRHEYEKKVNGRWIKGFGTGAKLIHGIYTVENPEAAAGTRPSRMTVEEVGLFANVIVAHNSNEACQMEGSIKFGSSHYLGTAGNMDKIIEAKEMFTHPKSFDILEYDNDYEPGGGKIGFFLPAYYTNNDFKDENGNTDVEGAIKFYTDRREIKKKSNNPKNYEGELMNYPILPSEMFLTRKGNIFPLKEISERLLTVEIEQLYDKLEKRVELYYDKDSPTGVSAEVDVSKTRLTSINNFPHEKLDNRDGCVVIYEFPRTVYSEVDKREVTPADMYIIGYDPYASDDPDAESLGAIFVLKNKKYATEVGHDELVAEYVGRPFEGRHVLNENLLKLSLYYGGAKIFFENVRGNTKEFFEKKGRLDLLAKQPKTVFNKGFATVKRSSSFTYGYPMSNRQMKYDGCIYIRDWLLEPRDTDYDGKVVRNIDRIPSRALLQELLAFNFEEGNYDRVMGFMGCIIGLQETFNQYKEQEEETVKDKSILSFLQNKRRKKLSYGRYI